MNLLQASLTPPPPLPPRQPPTPSLLRQGPVFRLFVITIPKPLVSTVFLSFVCPKCFILQVCKPTYNEIYDLDEGSDPIWGGILISSNSFFDWWFQVLYSSISNSKFPTRRLQCLFWQVKRPSLKSIVDIIQSIVRFDLLRIFQHWKTVRLKLWGSN